MKHPIQPIVKDLNTTDPRGMRFKPNAIVRYLLDSGPFDMNHLAGRAFPKEDRVQFAQLIGYSLGGFSELDYVDDDTYNAAAAMADGKTEEQAKIEVLENQLRALRLCLREPMAALFGVHPDDLNKNL